MADRLAYPLKDFAKAVGVSPNTARNWIKSGLQSYRVGGLVLILPAAVMDDVDSIRRYA